MSARHDTVFNPNPLQKRFIESRATADLFSSRMGEGKSTALCWSAYYHTRHNPGATWVLIRDTFENMLATTQKSFFQWFPPGVYGTYNGSKKCFTWASGVAKGEVYFLGLDDQTDATKLMSREFAGFGIDEPAPAVGSSGVDEMVFTMAMSRLRQPGMKWYSAKLAENNPDEGHWTYKRFVKHRMEGYQLWQPDRPENMMHLPASYYETLRATFAGRDDLVRRFVDGEFGFQSIGKAVTPQWSDKLHLATGLRVIPRTPIVLLWDFGHNPTCIFTQRTPLGHWNVLDALVGQDIGAEELITHYVKPLLLERYKPENVTFSHIGDPAGNQREQTSILRTSVKIIKKELGGSWKSGPVKPIERIEPLRSVLARNVNGRGLLQVDRERAEPVWLALRGGWHYNVARTGVVSNEAVKDDHSHPGDAMSYGAAILYPMGKLQIPSTSVAQDPTPGYFNRPGWTPPLQDKRPMNQFGPRVREVPRHGQEIRTM